MSNQPKHHISEEEFGQELRNFHHASLFDKEYQDLVTKELKLLSPEAQEQLQQKEKGFIEDSEFTSQEIDNILLQLPKKQDNRKEQNPPTLWWKKPFINDSGSISMFDPRFAMGYTFAIGFGLAMFLQYQNNLSILDQPQFRGGPIAKQTEQSENDVITAETRQDSKKWLAAIISLLKKGKTAEAQAQLEKFNRRYSDDK